MDLWNSLDYVLRGHSLLLRDSYNSTLKQSNTSPLTTFYSVYEIECAEVEYGTISRFDSKNFLTVKQFFIKPFFELQKKDDT